VSVVYGTTTNVAGTAIQNFRIGLSQSNRDIRFESNLEASQVPMIDGKFMHYYGMLLSSLSRTRTYTGGRRGVKLSNHKKLKMQNIVKNVIDLRVM